MSSSDASSSLPASLSSSLLSVIPSASFSIQSDWEQVLREFLQAKNSSAGTDALAKESKQFWASAARFGEDTSQRESIARLEDDHAAAASSSASSTSSAAAASSSSSSSSASSLAAAARAIRLNTKGPGSSDDLQLSFRSPLQVFIHSTSLNLTQMIQAPRATHMHLHPKGGEVNSVDISSNGNWGLSGGGDGTARVWDVQTGALKADLVGHKGDVVLTRWFPSGVVALTAGLDLSMKLWAVDPAPAQAAQLVGHSRPVTQVVFVGRGRNIISSSEDGTAKLWDVSRQQALTTYPSHKEISPPQLNDCLLLDPTSHPLAFNKSTPMNNVSELEGNLLLTAGEDGIIRGFDLRSSGQVFMLPVGGGGRVGGVEKLMQGMKPHSFMMGTGQGIISMVDLRNKQPLHIVRQDDAAITALRAWGEDSFWSSNSTGSVNLWYLSGASGSIRAQLSGVDCEPIHDLCFSGTGTPGVSTTGQGGIQAFVASHESIRVYSLSNWINSAAEIHSFHSLELPQPFQRSEKSMSNVNVQPPTLTK